MKIVATDTTRYIFSGTKVIAEYVNGGGDARCGGGEPIHLTKRSGTPFIHLDTANPRNGLWPAFVHFSVDYIGGNTIWIVIPRG